MKNFSEKVLHKPEGLCYNRAKTEWKEGWSGPASDHLFSAPYTKNVKGEIKK